MQFKGLFVGETCTGTGATQTLAGAYELETGVNTIPFADAYADGAIVPFVLLASNGVNRLEGQAVFDDAGTLTLSPWVIWNGTTYETYDGSGFTLPEGNHRLWVAQSAASVVPAHPMFRSVNSRLIGPYGMAGDGQNGNGLTLNSGGAWFSPFYIPSGSTIESIRFVVSAAVAESSAKVGLAAVDLKGNITNLIVESSAVSTATTGEKVVSISPTYFPAGTFVMVWIISDASISVETIDRRHIGFIEAFCNRDTSNKRVVMGGVLEIAADLTFPDTPASFPFFGPDGAWVRFYLDCAS